MVVIVLLLAGVPTAFLLGKWAGRHVFSMLSCLVFLDYVVIRLVFATVLKDMFKHGKHSLSK